MMTLPFTEFAQRWRKGEVILYVDTGDTCKLRRRNISAVGYITFGISDIFWLDTDFYLLIVPVSWDGCKWVSSINP